MTGLSETNISNSSRGPCVLTVKGMACGVFYRMFS